MSKKWIVTDPLDHDRVIADGIVADTVKEVAAKLVDILGYEVKEDSSMHKKEIWTEEEVHITVGAIIRYDLGDRQKAIDSLVSILEEVEGVSFYVTCVK